MYNNKYIFGFHPHFWHRTPKTLSKGSWDDIILDWGSPQSNGKCSLKKRSGDREEKTMWRCRQRLREWSDASTNQGTSWTISNHQKLGGGMRHGAVSLGLQRTNPVQTLTLDFWLQNWERIHFYCFSLHHSPGPKTPLEFTKGWEP